MMTYVREAERTEREEQRERSPGPYAAEESASSPSTATPASGLILCFLLFGRCGRRSRPVRLLSGGDVLLTTVTIGAWALPQGPAWSRYRPHAPDDFRVIDSPLGQMATRGGRA